MENPSTPLADYFWIAGVETISYGDPHQPETTIEEDVEAASSTNFRNSFRHSRQNSWNRSSKISSDGRFSIHTLDELDTGGTKSNRSSATIRPSNAATSSTTTSNTPEDAQNVTSATITTSTLFRDPTEDNGFDFDSALVKFAAEREVFLDDLTFSAGAKLHSRPPMITPRAERIKADELDPSGRRSPLRSIKGSIRRKMSFRDIHSSRKQPAAGRPVSVRTTKRLSQYNSVIPPPEPLAEDPDMHPLRKRFEPVLLDRYPPREATEEIARRGKFPDYVPMFAFPNDIQIVSSDDRPRSTWHGFTMTGDDNAKIYGITVIIWTAVSSEIAEQIEKRCEKWRQSHMSNEERELAASLGLRLAGERTHLSQLLAKLPTIASGTDERESLEDQISAVEEKISLMTEMLRPLRHGAASKIDGLTTGESGLWAPRAYGIMGRDVTRMAFWKEWLKAIVVPMTDGAILRVPATSPKVGRWQPLERYVINLCVEAVSPLSSKTQVELGVRELRLYARKEAANEIPGSRTIDIYSLFRSLSLENVVALFEYALAESRIIFLSSHTSMLHLACHALVSLLYPFKWASVFIPVLPARLLSVLEAPCPYIVGIERRYERIDLPDDDYVLVDLDKDTIDATSQPIRLPRQHRRKLMSLLQLAAPAKLRYGVTTGPPPYGVETFPYDAFSSENEQVFSPNPSPASLGKWVSQNSSTFGESDSGDSRPPVFNAFSRAKLDPTKSDRPGTGKSSRGSPPSSVSPVSVNFPPTIPTAPLTPVSRTDSGYSFHNQLREKRSGHFDERARRSSSFGVDKGLSHKPSMPFLGGHSASGSISAISIDSHSSYGGGRYAPSTYAQSTLAASTIMPNMLVQPVTNTETTMWVEGHCFNWIAHDRSMTCSICEEKSEGDGIFKCSGCESFAHNRCLGFVSLVCPDAFHPDRIRAAFVRCFASLLYTYRKYMGRPSKDQRNHGQLYAFDLDGFIKSLPFEQQEYVVMLRGTQGFNEFIHERERTPTADPAIRLFDEIILAKKGRGRPGLTTGISRLSVIRASHGISSLGSGIGGSSSRNNVRIPSFLGDTRDHIWRTASVTASHAKFPGDYHTVVTRTPTKLETALMNEPRTIQGAPRADKRGTGMPRKQVASMLGISAADLEKAGLAGPTQL
ncbi:DENN domain-containing protein [Ceratocystis fimbriata CBS 114723]|uniref:DENN domain-containing protein n=1 Tax=Ceratocystis fimbriata CBS 114723 TaxID=1035309 RepID=A0A2C5WWD9_9PEZI|nr:DENN domain-containing protein [Ceratocystis fimbriata CBS 114723]